MGFEGITLPFGVADMLNTAVEFLGIYGKWIVMTIAVIFAMFLPNPIFGWITYLTDKSEFEKDRRADHQYRYGSLLRARRK